MEDDVYEELGGRLTPNPLTGGTHRPKTPTPLGQPPGTDPQPTPAPGRRLYKSTRDNKPLHPVGNAKKLAARRQEEKGEGREVGERGEGKVRQVNGGHRATTPGPGRGQGDGDDRAMSDRTVSDRAVSDRASSDRASSDRASHTSHSEKGRVTFSHQEDEAPRTTRSVGQSSHSRTRPKTNTQSGALSHLHDAPSHLLEEGKPPPEGATPGHHDDPPPGGEGGGAVSAGRVRGDRAARRPGGTKPPSWSYWQEGPWAEGFPDETLTMDVTDISPGFAVRKIALLFENQQYGECTALVRRLSPITLKTIVSELPVERLVEALPQSVPVLEALYARYHQALPGAFPAQHLLPDRVVSRLVRWIATMEDAQRSDTYYTNYESIIPYAQSIIRTIGQVQPALRGRLRARRRGLEDCALSLAHHGLVDTSDSRLMNLHDALRIEFNKMIQQLKGAVMRLETVTFSQRLPLRAPLNKGGSSSASHQRLLLLTHPEVQERLIKNKSLLNVVEPALSNSYLAGLIQTLEARIDADKGILFHFAELRRDMSDLPSHALVAPLFQQYAQAYSRVLDVISTVTTDTNGYHSNDDDAEGPSKNGLSSSQNSGECYLPPLTPGGKRRLGLLNEVYTTSSGTSGGTGRESQPRAGIVSRQKASFSASSTTTTSNGLMSRTKTTNLAASTTHLPSATSPGGLVETRRLAASTQSLALPARPLQHPRGAGGSTQSLALPLNGHSSLADLEEVSPERAEVEELRTEVALLRKELKRCRETIGKMHEREKQMKDRLSQHAIKHLEAGSKFENLTLGDNRPSQLIRRYGNLYSQTRVDAYDALDDLPEMAEFDDLKGKLLFSVVVLAFRSVQHSVRQLKARVRHLLYLPAESRRAPSTPVDPVCRDMEDTVTVYLRRTVDKYDLSSNIQEVSQQVWATLFDYPSLKSCRPLRAYIEECVTLAWALSVQVPPLTVDYECRLYDPDVHTRFHTSDPDSDRIKAVMWPALVEADNGPCVHKAVVIT